MLAFLIFFFGIATHNFVFRILNTFGGVGQLPSEATVELHRASALGWDGVAATKSSLPTVSQAGTVATITPPVNTNHPGSTPAGRRFPASFGSISALPTRKSQMASRCERGEQNLRAKWQTERRGFRCLSAGIA